MAAALMHHEEFTRTALMHTVVAYGKVFGQKAAVSALECLMRIVKQSMAENQKTAEDQRRSREALKIAIPHTASVH